MSAEVLTRLKRGGCTIEAVVGDITKEEVDAIVNPANQHLAHIGGLADAIAERGGQVIQDESFAKAPVEVGGAVSTSAGDLPCRWVIHAVGPMWGEGDEEAKLRSAVRSSLDEAVSLGVRSLTFPAVSTGIFGYPEDAGTRVIVEEIVSWVERHPGSRVELVRLIGFEKGTAESFAVAVKSSV